MPMDEWITVHAVGTVQADDVHDRELLALKERGQALSPTSATLAGLGAKLLRGLRGARGSADTVPVCAP